MTEEGSKHFANVYENGFWEGLFYVEMEAGYFNFIANFLTAISSLIAIEFSPIITVYGSLFFVLLPIYFVLFRESKLFDNNKKKLLDHFYYLLHLLLFQRYGLIQLIPKFICALVQFLFCL